MKFCGHCGHQLIPEARFCVGCGTAVTDGATSATGGTTSSAPAAADATVREASDARQPEFAAAGARQGGYAAGPGYTVDPASETPAAAPTKASSAFAGVPVSDFVRDGIAALSLIMSLFMVWIYGGENSTAATRVDVILITLVSLLSLGISYVWRAGVFGPKMGYRRIQDLKLLANAPYLLLVLVYVALHLITAESFGSGTVDALGPALAFGLAGALLAAQPRHGDIAPGQVDQPRNQRWIYVTLGVAGLAAAAALVQVIRYWVAYGDTDMAGWGILATIMALASPAVLLFIALRVYKRSDGWRSVGVALGIGAGFLSLLALADGMTLLRLDLHAFGPDFSLLFWMGFGAAVSAPSIARLTEASAAAPASRRQALLPFLYLSAALSALLTVGAVIALITKATNDFTQSSIIPQVIAVLFGLLLAAGAVIALRLTAKDPRSVYLLPSGYAGLMFVLGLILMIVWSVQEEMTLGTVIMLLTFVLPAAILAVLWLPVASREHFRSLPGQGNGASGFVFAGAPVAPAGFGQPVAPVGFGQPVAVPASPAASPQQQAAMSSGVAAGETSEAHAAATSVMPATVAAPETPATPAAPAANVAAPAADVAPELLAEAANPATPLGRLQELAANHPEARPAIAANPSTYPGLLAWLGQLGDPAVDAALRQRR